MKWADLGKQEIAILIPTKAFNKPAIENHYIEPLEAVGISREKILVLNLGHNAQGKYPINDIVKPWLENIERVIPRFGIKHLIVCEGTYFKKICNVKKAEPHYGYALPTIFADDVTASICPNYQSLFYNPDNSKKIDLAIQATSLIHSGKSAIFDENPAKNCIYPTSNKAIRDWLHCLHEYKELSVDIEAYSLKVDEAGIGTIAFAWDTEYAISFWVRRNRVVRQHLKTFFMNYSGKLKFHNAPYDTKVLIWELFMEHPMDYFGMLQGLHCLFRNLDDTKILAFLSQNSTADISYDLKSQAFEFSGNYAVDVEDITKVDPHKLLEYNAIDTLATNYIHARDYPKMLQDHRQPYEQVFHPAIKVITQMELCGMPINMGQVLSVEEKLDDIARTHKKAIMADPIIRKVEDILRTRMAEKATAKLKKKVKTKEDYLHESFNPGSPLQLQVLLYNYLGLPVLDKTDTGQPATGAKTLKALKKRATPKVAALLEHIIEWAEVSKILNTFIPAFKNNSIEKDGWHYLHGGFNMGGARSGRQSSSKPNLQNLPSTGTKYAKLIKSCFQAPPFDENGVEQGWICVGADFVSLEDRISALQTKDPNKLKIYTDGYDGHCLRAYSYFKDQMPDIDPNSVLSINSIEVKYPELRQESKSPTFLLTYMGTAKGLRKTFGFTPAEADTMYEAYHEMYKVSDEWVMDHIKQAQKTGYMELAFGLRLRTPILPQVVLESDSVPFQAHKEVKTAGNALGQSYGLLNTRAANEFMQRVWDSPYKYDIVPTCQIHDSLYFMVRNRLDILEWLNNNLIECMEWNELPEIQHETVKLRAELEVYYPSWSDPIKIPNKASRQTIKNILIKALKKENKQ
jgi:DNA polymerase-1